jgi:3-hydroxyacyl-CoA dehydrogenase
LTESAVGLVPGWGGCKELVRRNLAREFMDRGGDAHQVLKNLHAQVAMAKVSNNARDAQAMGYLPQQASLVTRRSQLLPWAVRELQRSLDLGYAPPVVHQNTHAAGRDGLANLEMEVFMYREAGYISEHDALIATKLANVLCGGRLASPAWMDEQWFLDLEREANLSLAGETLSRDRIVHMLTQKKPLRN